MGEVVGLYNVVTALVAVHEWRAKQWRAKRPGVALGLVALAGVVNVLQGRNDAARAGAGGLSGGKVPPVVPSFQDPALATALLLMGKKKAAA